MCACFYRCVCVCVCVCVFMYGCACVVCCWVVKSIVLHLVGELLLACEGPSDSGPANKIFSHSFQVYYIVALS